MAGRAGPPIPVMPPIGILDLDDDSIGFHASCRRCQRRNQFQRVRASAGVRRDADAGEEVEQGDLAASCQHQGIIAQACRDDIILPLHGYELEPGVDPDHRRRQAPLLQGQVRQAVVGELDRYRECPGIGYSNSRVPSEGAHVPDRGVRARHGTERRVGQWRGLNSARIRELRLLLSPAEDQARRKTDCDLHVVLTVVGKCRGETFPPCRLALRPHRHGRRPARLREPIGDSGDFNADVAVRVVLTMDSARHPPVIHSVVVLEPRRFRRVRLNDLGVHS